MVNWWILLMLAYFVLAPLVAIFISYRNLVDLSERFDELKRRM